MSAQLKQVSPPTPVTRTIRDDGVAFPSAVAPSRRRPVVNRRSGIIAGACLAVAAVAATVLLRGPSHPAGSAATAPSQTISVGVAAMGEMERDLVVNGSLAAWDELPVGNEAGDLAIVEIAVEEGDRVSKGQILARLDDSVMRAQLAQAEASIAQAEAGLQKAEAEAAIAGSDVGRAKALIKNGYISGQVAEQRATTLATAHADVNVARQNLEAARALRDERRARLAQSEIRAPTDGVISKRTATLGNVVPVGTQLFRMIRDGRVELRAEIPEMDLPAVKPGQTATIRLDGTDAAYEGKIRLIGATVDPQTRIGLVYIALPTDPALKPGMFVHGTLRTGKAVALQVPAEAVVFKDGKPAVFVVGADDHARLRMVETGGRSAGRIEIVSGVSEGDRVALGGAGYLKDNDLVRVEAVIPAVAVGGANPVAPAAVVQ